ncbi:MAG: type I secretion C-terminal target domain-containing protein [Alphaproteobacteria bacterium]|nr:type I secretion C-terminal target domain-containing protein [Alphaproteobacteria bacterium]
MLIGGEGNDVLWSSAGNDILVIGKGKDIAYGGAGVDTFAFDTFDKHVDVIQDFKTGHGGDILNITDILEGYDPFFDKLSNFVKLVNKCGSTELMINADGDKGGKFVTIAVFEDGLNTTLQKMIDHGNLVADQSVLV